MRLTVADKFALMLTSAPSQRALASYLGVSHQKVGRWLQGERVNPDTGVISNVPIDSRTIANIDTAFEQYKRAVKDRARADGLPFDARVPVAFHRLETFRGAPSLRVVAERLQHLRPDLFDHVVARQIQSGRYFEVMVRSVIDLALYIKRGDERLGSPRERVRRVGRNVLMTQLKHRDALMKKLEEGRMACPIWTKRVQATPGTDPTRALANIHSQLRQKHEPATSMPGTVLADQVMFSLLPPNHKPAHANTKAKPKARTSRKNLRGRGPK